MRSLLNGISLVAMVVLPVFLVGSCKAPQELNYLEIEARQPVLPVLAGKVRNKVLIITLIPDSAYPDLSLRSFHFSLAGTSDLNDIRQAQLLYSPLGDFEEAAIVGAATTIKENLTIASGHGEVARQGRYWLSLQLVKQPRLTNKISARLTNVDVSPATRSGVSAEVVSVRVRTEPGSRAQRIGIALRQAGEDGVHTYRIPGLATTNKGTLLGVYDVRHNGPVDLQEDIDVGMSRSTDGGRTWEPMQIIMDLGTYGGRPASENGIGDPAILVDRKTNTVWVAALWSHGHPGQRAWHASAPGIGPEKTGQLVLVNSKDDGLTWSAPISVTAQMKHPAWQLFFNGPGKGICLQNGTLVFAAQFKDENRIPHATIIYSKDHGTSWSVGTGVKPETTEAQVVELADGSLMLNMRDDRNRSDRKDTLNGRSVAITHDLGATWTEHPTSRKALREPNCMASIIAIDHAQRGKVLFFSNPDAEVNREHITIKTSFDEGMTWPRSNQLELYEEDTYGYSCLTMVDKGHLGILYEGIGGLIFEKISLRELFRPR